MMIYHATSLHARRDVAGRSGANQAEIKADKIVENVAAVPSPLKLAKKST